MAQSSSSQAVPFVSQSLLFAVFLLLISNQDPLLKVGSSIVNGNSDDPLEEDDLGADMFPEKSYKPGKDYRTVTASEAQPYVHNAPTQVDQLQHLIQRQQYQLEHLERLSEMLHQSIDKLQVELLGPPRRTCRGEAPASATRQIAAEDELATTQSAVTFLEEDIGGRERIEKEVNEVRKDGTGTPEIVASPPAGIKMPHPPWTKTRGEAGSAGHGYGGGMTVARYKPAWSEHFQFLSAVKVDGEVTCLHVLPHEGEEGVSRYVAVGDETGRVYIFLSHGDLLVDFSTISHSPVTAMLSFSSRKNETIFLTGHSDGTVLVHKIWETTHGGPSYGDDWHALSMEHVRSLVSPGSSSVASAGSQLSEEGADLQRKQRAPGKPVTILEIYRVGKMRYILVADLEGKIQVFRENGTFYGVAESSSQPLAFLRSPNTQRLLFLTESGAASLDLRSMTVRSGPCEGLNGSTVVAYAFDAAGRSKAYGFTAEGDMIYVALSGDTLHFECHVRTKKKLEIEGPLAPQGIKGYLLVATPMQVSVYNTTLQVGYTYANIPVGGPRPLFTAAMDDISLSFVNTPIARNRKSVMACNREKLVVLGFGDGYVGIYKSNLPVQRPPDFNTKVWSSPVFITILVLLGGWYFFGKKRDPASTWNTVNEIALASSSATMPGYVRTGLGEARDNHMESRRFSSPSKGFPGNTSTYSGNTSTYSGGSLKFRNSTVEQSFRTSAVEPNYRASTVEPSAYSTRIEPHFTSTPSVVEESLHQSSRSPREIL